MHRGKKQKHSNAKNNWFWLMRPEIIFPSICPCFPNFFFFFFALKNNMFYYYQEWPAWGGGCTGLRVCVRCEGQMIIGRLKERE